MKTEEEIKELKLALDELRNEFEQFKQLKIAQTMLTTEEAAKELGLTRQGILFHIRKGRIATLGGKQRYKMISAAEIQKYKSETDR
ncbi:MAG: helix-turn-helix domain-containing protein [Bacteroidota bacterium]